MLVKDRTKGPVNIRGLANMVTQPKPLQYLPNIPRPILISNQLRNHCSCESCGGGMGFYNLEQQSGSSGSILGAISMGAAFVPGVGTLATSAITIFNQAISQFESWLGIGAGRQEADVIVPLQNQLSNRLDQITDTFRIGQNPSVSELQASYRELWQLGVAFMEFVLQSNFTDRRASGQALNTVMPYIDGTCGYPEPLGYAIPATVSGNCLTWGNGQLGGPGTDGMMGALKRAIQAKGGTVPTMPATMISAANTGFDTTTLPPGGGGGGILSMGPTTWLAIGIGILSLMKFRK